MGVDLVIDGAQNGAQMLASSRVTNGMAQT